MRCAELEALLCDYVDGVLAAGDKAVVSRHLEECAACAELARDAAAAVAFMERAAEVETPQELVTRILFEAPIKKQRTAERRGFRKLLAQWLAPVLQPRFAMGMAMTILSFSMLGQFAGIRPRPLRADDLRPAKVVEALADRAHRTWDRAVKYYESLRLVYEIQSRLKEWTEPEEGAAPQQPAPPSPAAPKGGGETRK